MEYGRVEKALTDIMRSDEDTGDHRISKEMLKSYRKAQNRLSKQVCDQDSTAIDSILDGLSTSAQPCTPGVSGPENNSTNFRHAQDEIFSQVEDDDWQSSPGRRNVSFRTRGQARRGSHHGRGGRLHGSGAQVRKYYLKYAGCVIRKRLYTLISECTAEQALLVCEKLTTVVGHSSKNLSKEEVQTKLLTYLDGSTKEKILIAVYSLPLCVVGVTARFSKSDSIESKQTGVLNVCERHIVNTWVDRNGHIRCTCLGSTQYDIFALNEQFDHPCCVHADAFRQTLKQIGINVFGNSYIPFHLIYSAFALIEPEIVERDGTNLPLYRNIHDCNTVVLVCKDVCGGDQLCWVPIRRVQRSGGRYLCAFCDMISTNRCHHITELRKLYAEGIVNPSDDLRPLGENSEEDNADRNTGTEGNCWAKNHQPVSYLPVAPVNCSVGLCVDHKFCELVEQNGVFKLNAPFLCIHCQFPRLESSRRVNTSGVVMCSFGACSMQVETYICSVCNRKFSAEGIKEGIFLDSVCLAATHKLLRDQLTGFALGDGTLSSRISQFHSQVTAYEDAKLFQNHLPCRSTRKLYDLCVYFVRLMVYTPHNSLFICSTCQGMHPLDETGSEGFKVPRAICEDGIWAGYMKKPSVPFENVSELCNPIASFSRSVKSSFHKPRTTFLRLEKTVTFLMQPIKGDPIEVNLTSLNALSAGIRLVDDTTLPVDFYPSSVCGTFPND